MGIYPSTTLLLLLLLLFYLQSFIKTLSFACVVFFACKSHHSKYLELELELELLMEFHAKYSGSLKCVQKFVNVSRTRETLTFSLREIHLLIETNIYVYMDTWVYFHVSLV